MNLTEFREKSLADFGFVAGRGTTEVSDLLLFRWPVAKASLKSRDLYAPASQVAVERVALAFAATTKPAPRRDWPFRCLDICLAVPSQIKCARSSGRLEAVVRITRHDETHVPMIVTAFVTGVVGEQTRAIFMELAASLKPADLVALGYRMGQLAGINRAIA